MSVVFVVTPSACLAGPLDIPAAVPAKFRALVRAGMRSHGHKSRLASESRFDLKTKGGYRVTVIGVGDIVALQVFRGRSDVAPSLKHGRAFTAYVARGTVTPGQIEASFGGFGRISVHFRPSGRVVRSTPRRRCRGADRFTRRFGVFAGRIRFTGEGNYVAVRAHRAKGLIRSPIHLHCAPRNFYPRARRFSRPAGGSPRSTPTILDAHWRQALSSTNFFAFQVRKKTLYLAVAEQSMGSVAEVRYAIAIAPSKTFVRDDALTSATLEPPAPFHGKGIYGAAPDGTKSWAGSLTVAFPGAPRFPLTGTQFEEQLAAGF
ncbi:MAG: hypothetical protein ACJ75S_03445 [Solirubrobacterales bacterium]